MTKRFDLFEIILIIAVMGIGLYAAFSDAQNFPNNWFTRDDAYYYFKVAQNISEGHGSTFDGINPTNGYHPLWMLICVPIFALARFDLILPLRILLLVLSGLSVASGILIYRLLKKIFSAPVGALMATYWVFNYETIDTIYKQGLETGIAVFCILILIHKLYEFETTWRKQDVSHRELIHLGACAALTLLSRLDLIFVVAFIGIWIIFRRQPIRYLLPLDLAAVATTVLLAFLKVLGASQHGYYFYATAALTMIGLGWAIKIPLAYFMGLYERTYKTQRLLIVLWRLILFTGSSSIMVGILMLILQRTNLLIGFPRTVLIYDLILTFGFFTLIRLSVRGLSTTNDSSAKSSTPMETLQRNWHKWLDDAIYYFGVAFGTLLIYMLSNKVAFGTFSPVSGQIKRWWATLPGDKYGGAASTLLEFFGLDYFGSSNAWAPASSTIGLWAERLNRNMTLYDYQRYLIMLTLFAALFYLLLHFNRTRSKRVLAQLNVIPLLCGSFLQVYYYNAVGYSASQNWYWVTQFVLTILVLGMIVGMLYELIAPFRYRHVIAWIAIVTFGLNLGNVYFDTVRSLMPYGQWPVTAPNLEMAAFLESATEPGSRIGITGGGNVAYFIHDRTIVNLDGLINSYAYFQAVKQHKVAEFLADEGLNYIFARTYILGRQPYLKQFDPYLERTVYSYEGKDLLRYHSTLQTNP
jgi:hypothetical protein